MVWYGRGNSLNLHWSCNGFHYLLKTLVFISRFYVWSTYLIVFECFVFDIWPCSYIIAGCRPHPPNGYNMSPV